MKYPLTTLCFVSLLLLAIGASAQNAAYSSYYTYTVSYNGDGSANVTPTAEVTGIDDVSDWIEGQYRPVCNVKPKIQLNGDADWVLGQGWGLGHAVDQVRTGSAVYVPADGSTVGMDYSVEVDVKCTGAPNQAYFQYPSVAYLSGWSYIDLNFWYLLGFSTFQTSPPSHIAYCPSAVVCPVGYGVASILNFVDFADFASYLPHVAISTYQLHTVNGDGSFTFVLNCPNGNQHATCGTADATGWEPSTWLTKRNVYTQAWGCFPIGVAKYEYGPPAPRSCT